MSVAVPLSMEPGPAVRLDPPGVTFLARHGQAGVPLMALPGDASARRYYRLPAAGLLLMEDRTDPEGFSSYIRVARHLNGLGLSAPRVEAADPVHCLALIEDWGDATYARRLKAGRSEAELYALAIDALAHLHRAPDGASVSQPFYDRDVWLTELSVFCDWFAPALAPDLDRAAFTRRFLELWDAALAPLYCRQEALVLRDFHVDNLMELDGRDGVARCGLLDFQDALRGPREYDLVSLLQDARRDLAPGLEEAMLGRYIAALAGDEAEARAIRARYHLMGAQRHARIAGVFVRLCQRDGKAHYLTWLPRVLRQFETALSAATLTPIADFLADALPDWRARGEALASRLAAARAPA